MSQRLPDRPLLSPMLSGQLVGLFKALANDTRLRILHHLIRSSEATVNDIAGALGMSPQAISNQLQRMSDWGILKSRREGISIHYRVVNPCVAELLDRAVCWLEQPERTSCGPACGADPAAPLACDI